MSDKVASAEQPGAAFLRSLNVNGDGVLDGRDNLGARVAGLAHGHNTVASQADARALAEAALADGVDVETASKLASLALGAQISLTVPAPPPGAALNRSRFPSYFDFASMRETGSTCGCGKDWAAFTDGQGNRMLIEQTDQRGAQVRFARPGVDLLKSPAMPLDATTANALAQLVEPSAITSARSAEAGRGPLSRDDLLRAFAMAHIASGDGAPSGTRWFMAREGGYAGNRDRFHTEFALENGRTAFIRYGGADSVFSSAPVDPTKLLIAYGPSASDGNSLDYRPITEGEVKGIRGAFEAMAAGDAVSHATFGTMALLPLLREIH